MDWDGSEDSSEGSQSGGAMSHCPLRCSQGQCGCATTVSEAHAYQ